MSTAAQPNRVNGEFDREGPSRAGDAPRLFDRAAWLMEHYRCPICGSEINSGGVRPCCKDTTCPAAGGFPQTGGKPVLVDFANSVLDESRFSEGNAASPTRRNKQRWWHALSTSRNRVAGPNGLTFKRLLLAQSPRPVVLIVGGGGRGAGTETLYHDPNISLVSFDIYDSPEVDFVADGHSIPLAPASVDGVWIQAVLEHVLMPERVVAEIHRVLKPGGLVYAETPFMQQVHEGPYDFTRFTESGHRWLFRKFELIDSGACLGPADGFAWSLRYLLRGLLRHNRLARAAMLPLFWVRALDRFVPAPYAIDAASGVFFMGRRSDMELKPRDIIRHYKGAGQ